MLLWLVGVGFGVCYGVVGVRVIVWVIVLFGWVWWGCVVGCWCGWVGRIVVLFFVLQCYLQIVLVVFFVVCGDVLVDYGGD